MAAQRGRHFDPDLLDVFLAGFDEFCAIARGYPDDAARLGRRACRIAATRMHDGPPATPSARPPRSRMALRVALIYALLRVAVDPRL